MIKKELKIIFFMTLIQCISFSRRRKQYIDHIPLVFSILYQLIYDIDGYLDEVLE